MKEIHYYECGYCGKRFDDEDECRAHEIEEKMGSLVDGFALYDERYQPITFKNLVSREADFNDVFYVAIRNKEAGEALNNFVEKELGYSFYEDTGMPPSYPCGLGFLQNTGWTNLTEIRKSIDEILTKALDNGVKM